MRSCNLILPQTSATFFKSCSYVLIVLQDELHASKSYYLPNIATMSGITSRFSPQLRRQLFRSFSTSRPCSADHARIVEVGPRDGLQNEKKSIPLPTKVELINRLAKTGITHMEAGSFVPAKWVPQVKYPSALHDTPKEGSTSKC